jgi:peptidoglycan/LPS O-acetylase OafA/YrhL
VSTFRPDIEGMRALSIALVIAYHFAPAWLPGGFIGVDVFFVISGYLITLSILDLRSRAPGAKSVLLEFWSRRARRLLPNALAVLLVAAVVALAVLPDTVLSRLGNDVSWASAYSINWLFVARSVDYLRWGETQASPLLNYWSLAVEEQFYLLWPLVLLALLIGVAGSRMRHALLGAVGLCGLSLVYAVVLGQDQLTRAFFSSPARAWELLAGAGLALWLRGNGVSEPMRFSGGALAWIGLAAIALAAVVVSHDSHHPGPVTLLPVVGAVLMVVGMGSQQASWIARTMACTPMRALGARSYSLYLWHWPTLVLGRLCWPAAPAWWGWALLALSMLLAEAAFRWVESPMRWRWGRGMPAPRVLGAALLASACMLLLGHWLSRLADAGARTEILPGAVRGVVGLPPLAITRNDLPLVYANGCHLGVESTDLASKCRLGDMPDGPRAVLFGDSHAAQWVPALLPASSSRGWSLVSWTKSSCPSADVTVWNKAARGAYRECDRWREEVFTALARDGFALVIVANLVDEETELIDRATGARLRGAAAQREFRAGLARSLQRLSAMGAVVLIRDSPRPRSDVLDCLYSSPSAQRCERLRSEALSNEPIDAQVAQAVGVPVWDFTDDICGLHTCPVMMAGRSRPVYRDDNHLSASYVASLVPAVEARWSRNVGAAR